MNLVEGLLAANDESRRFLVELEEKAKLLDHESAADDPGLALSKTATLALIEATDKAVSSGDVVEMVKVAELHGLGGEGS